MAITPVVFKLSDPITHGKETFTELTFARERRTKDLVAADAVQGQTRKNMAVYASMAGVPFQVLLEMTTDDFDAMTVEAAHLLGKQAREMKEKLLAIEAEAKEEKDASAT